MSSCKIVLRSCFWHCLSSIFYPGRWAKIPRNDFGFAINKRHVKEDKEIAKEIKLFGVGHAAEMSVHPDRIKHIADTSYIEIIDLHWITHILKIRLRLTISDETGLYIYNMHINICISIYIYNMYIYMYIYIIYVWCLTIWLLMVYIYIYGICWNLSSGLQPNLHFANSHR